MKINLISKKVGEKSDVTSTPSFSYESHKVYSSPNKIIDGTYESG